MNARFAAVALASGLSVILASQLFPLPSLGSLVEANNNPVRTPIANSNASSGNEIATLAERSPVAAAPDTLIAPQAPAPVMAQLPQADAPAETVVASRAPEASPATDTQPVAAATDNADSKQLSLPPATTTSANADQPAVNDAEMATPAAAPVAAASNDAATEADKQQASDKAEAGLQVASADPTDMLPSEMLPAATTPAPDMPADAEVQTPDATPRVNFFEAYDECIPVDICIDHYLWSLYQRAPKEDKMKVSEQRAVTIKRKRKMVTVMRTFTRLVDENFAWKDEAASGKAGMTMEDYVIGGMDRSFKVKLFHVLYAAEEAGLSPGITSAFRDDYRQAIASGLKAANDRSYHGGSFRGGYGHGLAADIVSVKGASRAERWASTEVLWKWIDAHGKEYGIGRPYLSYDPPHVGPTDGQEYISRRGDGKTREAHAEIKPRRHVAAKHERSSARRAKVASAKGGKVRSARNVHGRTT